MTLTHRSRVLCQIPSAVAAYNIPQEWIRQKLDDSFMAEGGCVGVDVETQRKFFADKGRGIKATLAIAEAKGICLNCTVRSQCLEYAIAAKIDHGIWGGSLPEERDQFVLSRDLKSLDDQPLSTVSEPSTPSLIGEKPSSGGRTPAG